MSAFQAPGPPQPAFDPSGQWRNPAHVLPFPNPADMGVGYWEQEVAKLTWVTGTAPSYFTARWTSPVFDLRPELRHPNGRNAAPSQVASVPIWRGGAGAGGTLYVFVNGLALGNGPQGVRVWSQHWAHPMDSFKIEAITGQQDQTSVISNPGVSQTAAQFTYRAPGDGYPIRFWRMALQFEVLENIAAPSFALGAAYY